MNRVISESLSLVDPMLKAARITVSSQLTSALPAVHGNSGKLQQVFLNLFLNARDAMESGGRLTVSTFTRGGAYGQRSVRLTVGDTGTGIAPEHIARLFDPFFTTKGTRKGTGLGLSVSYGIVREHGGEIDVESELGKGARFGLTFPELASAEAPLPETPRPELVPVRTEIPAVATAAVAAASISAPASVPVSVPVSVPAMHMAQSDSVIR